MCPCIFKLFVFTDCVSVQVWWLCLYERLNLVQLYKIREPLHCHVLKVTLHFIVNHWLFPQMFIFNHLRAISSVWIHLIKWYACMNVLFVYLLIYAIKCMHLIHLKFYIPKRSISKSRYICKVYLCAPCYCMYRDVCVYLSLCVLACMFMSIFKCFVMLLKVNLFCTQCLFIKVSPCVIQLHAGVYVYLCVCFI